MSFIESFGLRIFSVTTYFFLAGILGAKDFGIVALANTFIQFTNIFMDMGIATAIIQREKVTQEHLHSFWGTVLIGISLLVINYVLAGLIAQIYQAPELASIFRVLSLVFVIYPIGAIQNALLQREFNFKAVAHANIIGVSVGGVVGVVLALLQYGVWSLVYQQLVTVLVTNLTFCLKKSWHPKLFFSLSHFRDVLSFGSKIMFNNIIIVLNRCSSDALIGYFLGTQALGYYSFAYKIYNIVVDMILLPISKVAMPLFASLQTDLTKLRKTFLLSNNLSGYVSMAAFTALAFIIPDVLTLLFQTKWQLSIPLIQIFSLAGILQFLYVLTEQALVGLGKLKQNITLNICICVTTVGLALTLLHFGLSAVAFTYFLRVVLLAPLVLFFIIQNIGISFPLIIKTVIKPYLVCITAILLLWSATHYLSGNLILSIMVKACIIGGVYLLGFYLLEPGAVTSFIAGKLPLMKKKVAPVAAEE